MKKFSRLSEGAQGLIVSVSLGVVAFTVAIAIKLLYQML
jgi:hypothetical protein